MKTGAPYGQVFDAVDRGCKGGDNSNSNTGGRGGGVIFLKVTGTLQNDGKVTCNGENGRSSHAGGGSGGSINLDIHNIKVLNYTREESYIINVGAYWPEQII